LKYKRDGQDFRTYIINPTLRTALDHRSNKALDYIYIRY